MKKLTFALSIPLLGVAALIGCTETFEDDCETLGTCTPPGDGDTGGTGDGDGDTGGNGGGGANSGGTGGTADPCDACTGDTPQCNAADECVQCTENDHCTDAATPFCVDEACSECAANADCTETDASLCDAGTCSACTADADCAHLSDTPACDTEAGTCVECTDRTHCSGGANVCERSTNTCLSRLAGELFACQECEYDDDCQVGQLCVEQVFPLTDGTSVGNFCTWRKDGRVETESACFPAGMPFIEPVTATSIEGESAELCTLRSTTCPGFLDHSQDVTGCDDTTPSSDAACGAAGFADGRCEMKETTPLCTYPCLSGEDCKLGSTCTVDSYCSL